VRALTDINAREFLMLGLLAVAVLYMGIYPKPFTDVMNASVADFLKHVAASKLLSGEEPNDGQTEPDRVSPEILLLVMACVIALVDLGVKTRLRTATYG
jgi:hypothetical protein